MKWFKFHQTLSNLHTQGLFMFWVEAIRMPPTEAVSNSTIRMQKHENVKVITAILMKIDSLRIF